MRMSGLVAPDLKVGPTYFDPATRRANRLKKPPVATPASLDFRPMAAPAADQEFRESSAVASPRGAGGSGTLTTSGVTARPASASAAGAGPGAAGAFDGGGAVGSARG